MTRGLRGKALVALAAIMLAACATGPRPVPDDREAAWSDLRDRLRSLSGWQAEGRLTVRTSNDVGNANFTWRERGENGFRLQLGGPLGQGGGRLVVAAGRATLTTADGARHVGADAGRLLQRLYGWDIPVSGLRQWLIGLPGDDADYRLDRFGRLDTLDWQGWRIEYRRHRNVGELDLPATLIARDAESGTELRVAIDYWDVDGGSDGEAAPAGSPVPLIGD